MIKFKFSLNLFSDDKKAPLEEPKINIFVPKVFRQMLGSNKAYNGSRAGRASGRTSVFADASINASLGYFYDLESNSWIKNTNVINGNLLLAREYATSLKKTTYSTVVRKIKKRSLQRYFKENKTEGIITCLTTGNIMNFMGLQDPEGVKSIGDIFWSWIDESAKVSYQAFTIVADTVRGFEHNVEIFKPRHFYTWNRIFKIDDIDKFLSDKPEKKVHKQKSTIYDLEPEWQNQEKIEDFKALKKTNPVAYKAFVLGEGYPDVAEFPFNNLPTKKINSGYKGYVGFIDPSFLGGDYTALSIVSLNESNIENISLGSGDIHALGFCWHLSWRDAVQPIAQILKKYSVEEVFYESNGIDLMPQEVFYSNYGLDVDPKRTPSGASKEMRIKKMAFFAPQITLLELGEDDKYYSENHIFNNQVKNWNVKVTKSPKQGEHDDAPDSLSSAIDCAELFL